MKMIVCVARDFGIGNEGRLLFSLPPDMKLFRETTSGKVVIMGRSTLDSFPGGKPLKNRVNIVLSRSDGFFREGAVVLKSPEAVLKYVQCFNPDDVFVIGGAQIYSMFAPYCTEAIVTKVEEVRPADSFFFDIDAAPEWRLENESEPMEYNGLHFTFCRYMKV